MRHPAAVGAKIRRDLGSFLRTAETQMAQKTSSHEVSELLADWSSGNQSALDKLIPLVNDELRRLARYYMRHERPDHTLQTTALVNEAYLKLVGQRNVHWENRNHFFAIAAQLMRRILVDHARTQNYAKRGGKTQAISLDETAIVSKQPTRDLVALDDALNGLAAIDPRRSKVVELRFFGGLSVEETAEVLKVSPVTVMRDWSVAKAWLYKAMTSEC